MKTIWKYSSETEAVKLIFTAKQIATGFYRLNNWVVVPLNGRYENDNTVPFPELDYKSIKGFWTRVGKLNFDIISHPEKLDPKLVKSVVELIEKSNLKEPNYDEIKAKWSACEIEILNEIYQILPDKLDSIDKIMIHPTTFGTGISFSRIGKSNSIMRIFLREDQTVWAIAEAIISALTRDDLEANFDALWQESEIVADFMVSQTSIAKIIAKHENADFVPTLKKVRSKQTSKSEEESEKFSELLGVPHSNLQFKSNGKGFYLGEKRISKLNLREKEILKSLINKNGQILSVDEVAETIFDSDDDFSLYAISKAIQRLRDKLEANGISGSYIQTVRRKGYYLKS